MRDYRTRDRTATVRNKRMGHLVSNRWALMADGLWRRGGQFEIGSLGAWEICNVFHRDQGYWRRDRYRLGMERVMVHFAYAQRGVWQCTWYVGLEQERGRGWGYGFKNLKCLVEGKGKGTGGGDGEAPHTPARLDVFVIFSCAPRNRSWAHDLLPLLPGAGMASFDSPEVLYPGGMWFPPAPSNSSSDP